MRQLLLLLTLGAIAQATVYTPTAFRIDGTGTAPSALTGTATASSGVLTISTGTFSCPSQLNEGILYGGSVYTITTCTSSTSVTVTPTVTNGSATAFTVLNSACYNTNSCNGWVLEIDVPTIATGGTFGTFGFTATSYVPTSPSVILTVTSKGYQGTANGGTCGTATTYTRTIYATHTLREPYPNPGTFDQISVSGTTTFRLALSDRVYASDTVTVQVANSFYTDGSSNTIGTVTAGTSVTNNSTLGYSYARAITNWTYPGWRLITGSTINLRATGFAQYPQNELPLACVIFSAQDAHSDVATSTQGFPTWDVTVGGQTIATDIVPVIEYVGNVSDSTFTNHDQITACYRSYPWLGDETAVMDSCDQTVTGSVTSGACVANERIKQATTNVLAYLDNIPLGTNAPSMVIGSIISQTSAANSTNIWTGQTSGCQITPTAAPVYVNPQPSPLYTPQYYLLDTTNAYAAAGYVDASFTMSGAHTSGTFVAGEKVTQQTSGAVAYLIDVTGANGSGPIHLGAVASGTWSTTTGLTLTGGTSGAVFTQTTTQTFAGSDSNSCAAALSGGQPGTACATINGALIKMEAFNNASSTPTHADACGTLYMAKGYYNWTGSSAANSNTTGKCWATLTPATGVTQAQVVIQGVGIGSGSTVGNQGFGTSCTSGSTNCGTPLHVLNETVNVGTGPTSVFNLITYLWLDNDVLGSGGTAPIYQVTDVYHTEDTWTNNMVLGLKPFSTTNTSFVLVRGSNLNNLGASDTFVSCYTCVGNTNTVSQNLSVLTDFASQGNPADVMPIVAFNTFYKDQASVNSVIGALQQTNNVIGAAFVQNLAENINTNESLAMFTISADSSSGTPVYNVMIWDNDVVGGRNNRIYNEINDVPLYRQSASEVGNIMDQVAIKTDTFNGTPAGGRIGNWAEVYGSAFRNNLFLNLSGGTTGWAASGSFCNEFPGINSYYGTITGGGTNPPTCTTQTTINYPQYKNRSAFDGTNGNTGGGDYDLLSNSPANNFFRSGTNILPYDIAGQIRNNSGWGSAGAYAQEKLLTPVFF